MKTFALFIFLASSIAFGRQNSQHKEPRNHSSHVHGSASLFVAFEGNHGQVEFKSPAESIGGFEYAPQTEADRKTSDEAIRKFVLGISKTIQFDPNSKCQFQKEKTQLGSEKKEKHSDFVAHFSVQCQSSVLGSTLTFDFSQLPRLHKVEITVLAGELQKTARAHKKPVRIDLK